MAASQEQTASKSVIVKVEDIQLAQQELYALSLSLCEAFSAYPDTQKAFEDWARVFALPVPRAEMIAAARDALLAASDRHPVTRAISNACIEAHERLRALNENVEPYFAGWRQQLLERGP